MPKVAANPSQHTGSRRFNAEEINALKERDNWTNFKHIGFIYLIIVCTIGGTYWSISQISAAGLPWWYDIPIAVIAIAAIGACQHQFGCVVHEGTHYILFRNRRMNEMVSDWLAAFPIYTTTHAFRLHHLAHHQFVNDPARDPNFSQAKDSGHWLDFPLTHMELLLSIAKQLNPLRLLSYIRARARYSALGVDTNPYADESRPGSPWVMRNIVLFAVGVPVILIPLRYANEWDLAAALLVVVCALAALFFWMIPESHFPQSRIEPVLSHRATALSRIAFMGLLYGGLTAWEYESGVRVWRYFGLLWILPLFTTFPLFMVLREWIQHGNADRGRYTNSRIIKVNPLFRFAVLPWGMDYHLPHHLFSSVPHYKLKKLHELMLRDAEYAAKGEVVEGWAIHGASGFPTVVDVLGRKFAAANKTVHVDEATLELADVNDRTAIQRHVEASRQGSTRLPMIEPDRALPGRPLEATT
jgi:fatty acid desaturase